MNTQGKVFKYKDNVDTDVIIPARYLNTPVAAELALHCMEDIDKDFVKNAPKMKDYLTDEAKEYFEKVKAYLDVLEIPYVVGVELMKPMWGTVHDMFICHISMKSC